MQADTLQREFDTLSRDFDGRIGVCTFYPDQVACLNPEQPFSLQSVMKLIVAFAVLDEVDQHRWRLEDTILVKRQDLSLSVQPLETLVGEQGHSFTIGDLVRRAIVDSDSAAVDVLIAKLGGPQRVQMFLDAKGIHGVRVDRDERHLQTEIVGLDWLPEYVDPEILERATQAVPAEQRTAAYRNYQADPRDTATPLGMTQLLRKLANGQLLSAASTGYVLDIMGQATTFPDRLKAGLPKDWVLYHKTGTSGSWQGVTAATNDAGILKAPDGTLIPVSVFIADSRAPFEERAGLIARIAAAISANYHPVQ